MVDLGFRGVDADNPGVEIIHRGKYKSLSTQQKGWLKRRTVVEPAIGHLKSDHRMDRCWLQGALGDALHAISCAAGYNLRWLLRAIARLGLEAVFFSPVACGVVTPTARKDVIRCACARVNCEYEQLDRNRGRQKTDFLSYRTRCFLKMEFCRAD